MIGEFRVFVFPIIIGAGKPLFPFTPGLEICDTGKSTEVLVCLSADSREEVDELIGKAVAAGGSIFRDTQDYGFMYGRAFRDLDGHIWELVWMDVAAMEQQAG